MCNDQHTLTPDEGARVLDRLTPGWYRDYLLPVFDETTPDDMTRFLWSLIVYASEVKPTPHVFGVPHEGTISIASTRRWEECIRHRQRGPQTTLLESRVHRGSLYLDRVFPRWYFFAGKFDYGRLAKACPRLRTMFVRHGGDAMRFLKYHGFYFYRSVPEYRALTVGTYEMHWMNEIRHRSNIVEQDALRLFHRHPEDRRRRHSPKARWRDAYKIARRVARRDLPPDSYDLIGLSIDAYERAVMRAGADNEIERECGKEYLRLPFSTEVTP